MMSLRRNFIHKRQKYEVQVVNETHAFVAQILCSSVTLAQIMRYYFLGIKTQVFWKEKKEAQEEEG